MLRSVTARLPRLHSAPRRAISLSTGLLPRATEQHCALGLRGFCAKAEAPKPKKTGSLASRLLSFAAGAAVAGTLAGYALFFKVHLASEELAATVREAAYRQAQIERRLAALEKQ
mmetsp:Transcript_7158/g.9260  ORF Transcript_7158/g.9260 Transcript_7158/m.9260 type:complete len:115 (-) Transcript_7158:339-683(-)